eukprot:jgi/Botrbrau1/12233/Bobra.0361s0003.1
MSVSQYAFKVPPLFWISTQILPFKLSFVETLFVGQSPYTASCNNALHIIMMDSVSRAYIHVLSYLPHRP